MKKTLLKAVISGLLIWWLFARSDMGQVFTRIADADVAGLAFAVTLLTGLSIVQAWRWSLVIRAIGSCVRFKDAFLNVLIGMFFNQVLPSSIGGDAMRIWGVYRLGLGVLEATYSVMLDRLSALLALVVMAVLGAVFVHDYLGGGPHWWGLAAVTVCGLGAFIALFAFDQLPTRWLGAKPLRMIAQLSRYARAVMLAPATSLPIVISSVLIHIGVATTVYIISQSIGLRIGIVDCLILVPPVILISMIPISIAGWGVRESAMITAFGFAGLATDEALALSVLFGLVIMFSGIPGGIVWLMRGGRKKHDDLSAGRLDNV